MITGNDKLLNGMRRIARYESKSLVASEYSRIHRRSANATKVASIVMGVKQGRELFESATRTDYMTKPIELYYGMASFMRSMLLMNNPKLSEGTIKPSHGLKVIGFPTNVVSAQDILNMQIKFESGVFTQWYNEAQELFALRTHSSKADWDFGYEESISGKTVTFGQILSLIPDVWKELSLVDDIDRARLVLDGYATNSISFNGKATQSQAEDCFPGIEAGKVTHMNNRNWSVNLDEMEAFRPQLAQLNEDGFNIGSVLVVPPLGDVRLSPLSAYVVAAYVMSMLARYRPSIWGNLWNGGLANEMYPLFSRLMTVMQDWFSYMYAENMEKLGRRENG